MVSIQEVVRAVILVICLGLVFFLLDWLRGQCGLPEPFDKVARVVLATLAVLCLVSVLLGLAGVAVVRW